MVTTLKAGDSVLTLTVGGAARTVYVHVPPQVGTKALPLVFALHGNGDTAQNFWITSRLKSFADSDGFVLIAPEGIMRTIAYLGNTIPNVAWDGYQSTAEGNIDLALFAKLRTDLLATGAIDAKRVSVYGYSQGGYASFRYAMEAAGDLSCAAVIAAANPFGGTGRLNLFARKIPVALQIGSADAAAANARATRDGLTGAGHPVQYNEIAGAGHVPLPGDAKAPLTYCLGMTLP